MMSNSQLILLRSFGVAAEKFWQQHKREIVFFFRGLATLSPPPCTLEDKGKMPLLLASHAVVFREVVLRGR